MLRKKASLYLYFRIGFYRLLAFGGYYLILVGTIRIPTGIEIIWDTLIIMSNPWDLRSCKEIFGMLKNVAVDLFLIWTIMHLIFNQTQTKSNTGLPNIGYLQSWMDWILDVSPTGHLRLDHPRLVLKNPGIRRLCQCVWYLVHQVFVGHIGHIYICHIYIYMVGGLNPCEKYEFVSWDDFPFPTEWKVMESHENFHGSSHQ